jgi:hypothetical protein
MKIQVFDKVKWHFPDGKHCPSLNDALSHFEVVISWLQTNDLLSDYGKELASRGIDSDFSLTSEMLTDTGNTILKAKYDEWLKSISYGRKGNLSALDSELARYR